MSGRGTRDRIDSYFETLAGVIKGASVTDGNARTISIVEGFECVRDMAHAAHNSGNKIIFIGNGGSAGIASHLAIDFSKNGGLRALAFNDAAALTCLGNDFGYESVFARQIDFHAQPGDMLVAISSSGMSANITAAVQKAQERRCTVATFSGFAPDNKLRLMGDVNFYVRSRVYGLVEIAHLSLCHAILDLDTGWSAETPSLATATPH
jgi:D-sedoheptulose 7-phosphate isomerase